MERTAKCLCGQFSVIVTGEPTTVSVCHCRDCQRRSGAPWTSNAYFPKENVRLDGPNKVYTRASNARTRINHHFCPKLRCHCLLDPRDRIDTLRHSCGYI